MHQPLQACSRNRCLTLHRSRPPPLRLPPCSRSVPRPLQGHPVLHPHPRNLRLPQLPVRQLPLLRHLRPRHPLASHQRRRRPRHLLPLLQRRALRLHLHSPSLLLLLAERSRPDLRSPTRNLTAQPTHLLRWQRCQVLLHPLGNRGPMPLRSQLNPSPGNLLPRPLPFRSHHRGIFLRLQWLPLRRKARGCNAHCAGSL